MFTARCIFWIILLAGGAITKGVQAQPTVRFQRFSVEDGLAQSTVTSVLQDRRGFLWVGTQDGLNRYDGYEFRTFMPEADSCAPTARNVTALAEDSAGNIWVGTDRGLSVYSYQTGCFRHYHYAAAAADSLSHDYVTALVAAPNGDVWVGTRLGLNRYDAATGAFERFYGHPGRTTALGHDHVQALCLTSDGFLWVGTIAGLSRYDPVSAAFTTYRHADEPGSLPHAQVTALTTDAAGNLWVGTPRGLQRWHAARAVPLTPGQRTMRQRVSALAATTDGYVWAGTFGKGLYRYNLAADHWQRYRYEPTDEGSLASNVVRCVTQDRAGIVWVGVRGAGLNAYDPQANQFGLTRCATARPGRQGSNYVLALAETHDGTRWVGTNGGLIRYNADGTTRTYYHQPGGYGLSHDRVWVVRESQRTDGVVWLGTDRGIDRFDYRRQTFQHFDLDRDSLVIVRAIAEDSTGRLWLATYNHGLYHFDPQTGAYQAYRQTRHGNGPSHDRLYSVYVDERQQVWFGAYNGLNRYNPATGQFKYYDPTVFTAAPAAPLMSITPGSDRTYWLATYGEGLLRFDPWAQTFTPFRSGETPLSPTLYAALESKNGDIWCSSNQGLFRVDWTEQVAQQYNTSDGLQSKEFNAGAHFQNEAGLLFFGGIQGFNVFQPAEVTPNAYVPPVVITDFRIFDERVSFARDVSAVEQIELDYGDSFVAFDFAALSFTNPGKNRYAYRLENFTDGWIDAGSNRHVSFTNLDGGRYVFRVKAANNDGLWNEQGASVVLIVHPPFWRTWWFQLLAASALVGGSVLAYRWRVRLIREQNRRLEEEVSVRTTELHAQQQRTDEANEQLRGALRALQGKTAEIEVANNKLLESIRYAERIQRRVLPGLSGLHQYLPESFALLLPCDIVSGDFYWIAEREGVLLVAAVDCTGHGVPGAFMSLIGHSQLNHAVETLGPADPAALLQALDRGIKEFLSEASAQANDGMELALCRIDFARGELTYAGARRPLFVVRAGQLEELKPDRRSVGCDLFGNIDKPFVNQRWELQPDDMIYLSSDGFTDQMGGPEAHKFQNWRFRELLTEISEAPCAAQAERLRKTFRNWQQDQPQVDDVLVVGFRARGVATAPVATAAAWLADRPA